jgi:hypothetical protein
MPEYSCEFCSFNTIKKSTFDDHLLSKKHLNNSKNFKSIENNESNNHYILQIQETQLKYESKIKDLETQLKNKEYEYESKIKDLENQLGMKELEIKNITLQLQLQLQQNTKNNMQLVITEPTANKNEEQIIIKETTLEKLNKRTNAMTIKHFENNCLNDDDFNLFIQSVSFNNIDEIMLPKSIEPSDYSNYIVVDVICKTLNKIPVNERPIYCSDVRRRHFYIKTEDGWLKHNEEETNKILQDLFWTAYKVIHKTFSDLKTHKNFNYILKELYKKDNTDNKAELLVQKITAILYPLSEERELHYSKLNVKLSEMTNCKNSKYKTDKKEEKINSYSSTSDGENYDSDEFLDE